MRFLDKGLLNPNGEFFFNKKKPNVQDLLMRQMMLCLENGYEVCIEDEGIGYALRYFDPEVQTVAYMENETFEELACQLRAEAEDEKEYEVNKYLAERGLKIVPVMDDEDENPF